MVQVKSMKTYKLKQQFWFSCLQKGDNDELKREFFARSKRTFTQVEIISSEDDEFKVNVSILSNDGVPPISVPTENPTALSTQTTSSSPTTSPTVSPTYCRYAISIAVKDSKFVVEVEPITEGSQAINSQNLSNVVRRLEDQIKTVRINLFMPIFAICHFFPHFRPIVRYPHHR